MPSSRSCRLPRCSTRWSTSSHRFVRSHRRGSTGPCGPVAPHAAVPRGGRRCRRAHRRVATGDSTAGRRWHWHSVEPARSRRSRALRWSGSDSTRANRSSRCWPTRCSAQPSPSATNPNIVTSPRTSRSRAPSVRGRWRTSCTRSATGPVGPVFHVNDVVLMESDTRWDGAVYREVASFPLGVEERPSRALDKGT